MNENTAKLVSIPIAACLSTFCLWLLCLTSPPKLEGHWHVCQTDTPVVIPQGFVQSIDFLSNNQLIFNKDKAIQEHFSGSWYRNEQMIRYGEECSMVKIKYRLEGDTLYLQAIGLAKEKRTFKALRQVTICD